MLMTLCGIVNRIFDAVEKEYQSILSDYGTATEISSRLFETETANMPLLGYGCKPLSFAYRECNFD